MTIIKKMPIGKVKNLSTMPEKFQISEKEGKVLLQETQQDSVILYNLVCGIREVLSKNEGQSSKEAKQFYTFLKNGVTNFLKASGFEGMDLEHQNQSTGKCMYDIAREMFMVEEDDFELFYTTIISFRQHMIDKKSESVNFTPTSEKSKIELIDKICLLHPSVGVKKGWSEYEVPDGQWFYRKMLDCSTDELESFLHENK